MAARSRGGQLPLAAGGETAAGTGGLRPWPDRDALRRAAGRCAAVYGRFAAAPAGVVPIQCRPQSKPPTGHAAYRLLPVFAARHRTGIARHSSLRKRRRLATAGAEPGGAQVESKT